MPVLNDSFFFKAFVDDGRGQSVLKQQQRSIDEAKSDKSPCSTMSSKGRDRRNKAAHRWLSKE